MARKLRSAQFFCGTVSVVAQTAERPEEAGQCGLRLASEESIAMMRAGVANSDVMYRLLVQGVTDYAIYMIDPAGLVSNWNAGAQRAKGYTSKEIVGQHFSCFYQEADRAAGIPDRNLSEARRTGRFEDEGWRLRKDGTIFWAHVVIDAIKDDSGALVGFAKITRDCTERRLAALRLQSSSDNLDLALSNMSQGLCLIDETKRIVIANGRFQRLFELPEDETSPGAPVMPLFVTALGAKPAANFALRHFPQPTEEGGTVVSELVRGSRTIVASTRRVAGKGWVSTFEDVTDRRRIETRIEHMAHHDELTGLLNRNAFREKLSQALTQTHGEDGFAVFYLDLDRFKPVNDTFGHATGDELLRSVATRLKRAFRQDDIVARVGGDEFAVIIAGQNSRGELARIAQRVVQDLATPFDLNGVHVVIGGSIGIAITSEGAKSVDALLIGADLALYQAKGQGRGCYSFYDEAMGEVIAARRSMETNLRQALMAGEFELHYQPVVRLRDNGVTGFEALLRWRSAAGLVPPSDFIPLAEDVGLMPQIGKWVIEEACREATAWPDSLTVAVNLSAVQLRNMDVVDTIEAALTSSGLAAGRLEIEVTETAVLENKAFASHALCKLRSLGVKVALDDFGTGYSSLSLIQNVPLTRIKIDRSFVKGLSQDPQSIAIVKAVISLATSLCIEVTAEGVETDLQRKILLREGCMDAQGYLFGKALPPGDIDKYIFAYHLNVDASDNG